MIATVPVIQHSIDTMVTKTPTSATYRRARRVAVFVIGGSLSLLGVALLVLPGPGIATIVVGLTVLAIEFTWARRWLAKLKEKSSEAADQALGWWGGKKPLQHSDKPDSSKR